MRLKRFKYISCGLKNDISLKECASVFLFVVTLALLGACNGDDICLAPLWIILATNLVGIYDYLGSSNFCPDIKWKILPHFGN